MLWLLQRRMEMQRVAALEHPCPRRQVAGGEFRTRAAQALGSALLGLALACARSDEVVSPQPAVIRLADRLDEARVSSALDGVKPAASLAALEGPVERHPLLATRFESGALPLVRPCAVVPGAVGPSGRGRVVRCGEGGALVLPVEPNRLYVLRALLRAAGERCRSQSVALVERREGEPIALRPFAEVGTAGWASHEATWQTRPETRRVDLSFSGRRCRGYVGEIELEEVRLSPRQELAWLAGRSVAAGEDPRRLRGRLLPLPDPETAAPPHDDAYSVRDALFAPAPSEISLPIAVPDRARLHVSYGLSRESRPGDAVLFTIEARAGDRTRVLLRETLALQDDADWHWRRASLDLSELAGRRTVLVFSTAPIAGRGFALWGSPMVVRERRADEPPNLILIAIDTLRADRLSAYGYAGATSPRIDAFARDAIRFERAISAANWTAPAFHALFTGHSAGEVGSQIPAFHDTLAELLRDAGYLTQAIVYKPVLYDQGFDQGFDAYLNVPRIHVRADHALTHALRFLDRHQRERFFLFLHLDDPHQPFTQPESHLRDADRARLRALDLSLPITVKSDRIEGCSACGPPGRVSDASRELASALYDDAVRYADHAVGTFLERLRELSLYDDAVIAIVSDHGEGLWQHDEHFGHAGPGLYDEVVRVPLLLKPPAARAGARGRLVSTQVRLADLFPTLLSLAGQEPAPPAAGDVASRSLLELLDGAGGDDRPALIRGEGSVAWRTPEWKYVRRLSKDDRQVHEQLFQLAEDPAELVDRARDDPAMLAQLRGELADALFAARARHTLLVSGRTDALRERRARLVIEARDAQLFPELSNLPWQLEDGRSELSWSGDAGALPALIQIRPTREARLEVALWLDDELVLSRSLALEDAEAAVADRGANATAPFEVRLLQPDQPADGETRADPTLDLRNHAALRALGYIDP